MIVHKLERKQREFRRGRKAALGIAAAGVLTLGIATPAQATVSYPGGGVWDYGTNNSIVWSYYYHGGVNHKSSVYNGSYHYSGCRAPGYWARATASDRWYAVDKSYWDYC